MSMEMMHAFEREYQARFSDLLWRAECEAFGRGWVAARDAGSTGRTEDAFRAIYRTPIDDSDCATQAEAFRRGWQAAQRLMPPTQAQGRVQPTAGHPTTDEARQRAMQLMLRVLAGVHPHPTQEPTPCTQTAPSAS